MRKASSTRYSYQSPVRADGRVSDGPIGCEVALRDLLSVISSFSNEEWIVEGGGTLMCCQTSDSGLMTLMSGWSAPR